MIPLLAQLGLALLAGKMQKDKQHAELEHATNRHFDDVRASIDARRAARAGDSGYMQAAVGGMRGIPQAGPSAAGPILAGVGQALLNRQDEPEVAHADFKEVPVAAKSWVGTDFDEDKYGSYA